MDGFIKSSGLVLLAVILCLALSGYAKQYTVIIALAVCCMVAAVAMQYLDPVLSFFGELRHRGGWNTELVSILLKAVGIGIISDIAVLVCSDSGQAALGKVICLLATTVMLWLSLPLFSELLDLIGGMVDSL